MAGRTLVTGDIHGHHSYRRLSTKNFPEGRILDKEDYLIVAGDFGLIWTSEPDATEKYLTKWFTNKKWTTLFVDGNHENFFRLNQLPVVEKFGGKVGMINDSIFHLKRGEIYTINGNKIFTFGGAESTDKSSRRVDVSWWKEELPTYQEESYALENLERHNFCVDYIIAHNGPRSAISAMGIMDYARLQDPICKFFDHIAQITTFKRFFFGHHHINKFASRYHCLYTDIVELRRLGETDLE